MTQNSIFIAILLGFLSLLFIVSTATLIVIAAEKFDQVTCSCPEQITPENNKPKIN